MTSFVESNQSPIVQCLPWFEQLGDLPPHWKLVACNGKKQPIDPQTGHLLSEWPSRCTPVEQFKDLLTTKVRAVGVALGPASGGLLAVDFDAEGYEEQFQLIYGKPLTDLPRTVSWTSGKPGRRQSGFRVTSKHWAYLKGRQVWKNQGDKTCLELRWTGHQSIVLGAHPETSGYTWCADCSPRDLEVAEAPEWLLRPLIFHKEVAPERLNEGVKEEELQRARGALKRILPRDDYEGWLQVGMALKSVGDDLLEDWIEWSRGSNCFDEKECLVKWNSFNGSGRTLGTLIYMADQDSAGQADTDRQINPSNDSLKNDAWSADELTIEGSLDELIRLCSQSKLDAEALLPPYLREAMTIIRATVEYEWSVMLLVLMVGISGALPLDSNIELIPGDFEQSLNLLACLLMDTGEAKSPLLKRLVSAPWKKSVDVVMKQRHLDAVSNWKIQKDGSSEVNNEFNVPRPDLANTLITEDLTPQGVERHLVLHDRYAKGSVLLLFDEGKDLLAEMAGQVSSTNQLKLGTWILSRYDGTGARGAKADATKERHYSQCRVASLICCQPDIYRQITGDADQSGLAGRFVAVEQPTVDQYFPEEFDPSHQQRHQQLSNLLSALYIYVCDRPIVSLKLSDEARKLFQRERKNLNDQKNKTLSDAERGQLNKSHGRLGRLAGILQLLWSFDPLMPSSRHLPPVVDIEVMQRAILLNRYLLSTSILVRQTSHGNSKSMQKIEAFQKRALKVNAMMKVSAIRRALQSDMRATPAETDLIVNALHRIGVGKLYRDECGTSWYQALRQIG